VLGWSAAHAVNCLPNADVAEPANHAPSLQVLASREPFALAAAVDRTCGDCCSSRSWRAWMPHDFACVKGCAQRSRGLLTSIGWGSKDSTRIDVHRALQESRPIRSPLPAPRWSRPDDNTLVIDAFKEARIVSILAELERVSRNRSGTFVVYV
jgi:hypothetical protein